MREAFVIDGIRSPIGSLGGSLSKIRADDLAASVIKALFDRHPEFNKELIEDVILGCANQAGEDNRNIARMASLLAGLPIGVPGLTVNRLCASGMSAVIEASRSIRLGDGDVYVAGGVEQMTRAPFVLSKSETAFGRNMELFDTSLGWRFVNPRMKELHGTDSMGETAENVAQKYNINRVDQDRFAVWSQQKANEAREDGRFEREIVGIEVPKGKKETTIFAQDEFIRPDTTFEILSKLRPAFNKDGSVTAGNSSGLNDGACALLVSSEKFANENGLRPRARIVASAVVGVEPKFMGIGPVLATKKVLAKAALELKQIDVIELNEAFAAQSLACVRELGLKDTDTRINPNGGAIALGHPLGMSGARLILTAMVELEQKGGKYALCTMCVGVGQGTALILERV